MHFNEVFSQTASAISMHDQFFWLRQGSSSVNDYAFMFHTLAAVSGWNETVLITAFHQELIPTSVKKMAIYDYLAATHWTLDQPASTSVAPPAPEPMQIDSAHLSNAERQHRILNRLCLYCGAEGHLLSTFPVRPQHPVVSTLHIPPSISFFSLSFFFYSLF